MEKMSPRFQELWEQCKSTGVHPEFGEYVAWNKQTFAELIVDECCLKLLDMDEKTKGNHNYYRHAAIEIKKHFGVTE
jgi:hypothetical protein